MYHKILVPVDGSDASNLGLTEAIRLAKLHGAELQLLHIVNEFILDYTFSTAMYANKLIDEIRERGKKVLKDSEARVRQEGVACEAVLIESIGGRAADFIVEQAGKRGADLIVMGTHGRRGLARLTMGSDAEEVVRTAGIPVLLVRGQKSPPKSQKLKEAAA
jgi:nucleotide-binding universal stress UspA family protein